MFVGQSEKLFFLRFKRKERREYAEGAKKTVTSKVLNIKSLDRNDKSN